MEGVFKYLRCEYNETRDERQNTNQKIIYSVKPFWFYTFLNKILCKEEDKFTKMTAVCHKVIVVGKK